MPMYVRMPYNADLAIGSYPLSIFLGRPFIPTDAMGGKYERENKRLDEPFVFFSFFPFASTQLAPERIEEIPASYV